MQGKKGYAVLRRDAEAVEQEDALPVVDHYIVPRDALFQPKRDACDVELFREDFLHLFGLVLAQQAVVHEHAGQLLADGFRAQRGNHGGVHAAGKAQNHAVLPPPARGWRRWSPR